MPILTDSHLHSSYSGDCSCPMEAMINRAVSMGLTDICFTEHQDFDFPYRENAEELFLVNTDAYLYELACLKGKYEGRINILFGIELGVQPQIVKELNRYVRSYEFDFVLASSHICHGKDPYYPEFFEGRDDEEAYREYFESVYENLLKFESFDVYAHLDYVVRYGAERDKHYSYGKYRDIFDKILTRLLEREKGLEVNTGGLRNGLSGPNPCADVIRRYRELGGEIITIGSDAHRPEDLAYGFGRAAELLKECGFRYYTVFSQRIAEYRRL